jgi:aspartate aminotransferase
MRLATRIEDMKPSATARMRIIANELKAKGLSIINFAAGELEINIPSNIRAGALEAIEQQTNLYTPTLGLQELRQQIAHSVTKRTGVQYSPKGVGLCAGAKQALYNAVMTLINPGDEVIIPMPYWVTFPTQVELAGGVPVFIDTRPRNYQLMASDVENVISSKTKAIIINTPNNPTGAVYGSNELEKIAQLAIDQDLWIIFDECYEALMRNGARQPHIVSLLPRLQERIIIVNSFSKSFALTGWRLGYVAAPEEIITALETFQGHTTSGPNSLAQHSLRYALADQSTDFISSVNHNLDRRLNKALKVVSSIPEVQFTVPRGAFYLFLDISSVFGKIRNGIAVHDADGFCELALREARIALVSGTQFGDQRCVRLSYSIAEDEMIIGLERLKTFLLSFSLSKGSDVVKSAYQKGATTLI